jgi:hypothetical protein
VKYRGLDVDPRTLDETVTVKPTILAESAKAFKEYVSTGDGTQFLLPRIEAIHAGVTRNHTRYPAERLKGDASLHSGAYSWLYPFAKPVIFNHDVNTEASGRVQAASFHETTQAGKPGIVVVPKITDSKAINDILGGRLLTVSIGATTDAAYCSICGTDIISEGFCGHMKGQEYDGQIAEWIVGNVYFDELSWVNVPADSNAMIVGGVDTVHQAESFAFDGRELINLGKTTTEWLVDPESVLAEGLTKLGRGESTLLTEEQVKALQEELESLKGQNATLVSEKEQLTAEVEQLKTNVGETTAAKETAEQALAEKEAELATVKETLTAKEAEVAELTTTKEGLEASLEEEKQARIQTVEENAKLATDIHKMVAEHVVDLRLSLGKESDREEAITRFVERSTDSLNDTLADLLVEAAQAPAQPATRQVEKIERPAGTVDNTIEVKESETKLTTQDVLMNLFGGPGLKK